MWSKWYCTDTDCCQHVRHKGTEYEMVQAVWLDTTLEDKANGSHEYCIVSGGVDISDFTSEEIEVYVSAYKFVETPDEQCIAECILEQTLDSDEYVISDADSFEEAGRIITDFTAKSREPR